MSALFNYAYTTLEFNSIKLHKVKLSNLKIKQKMKKVTLFILKLFILAYFYAKFNTIYPNLGKKLYYNQCRNITY